MLLLLHCYYNYYVFYFCAFVCCCYYIFVIACIIIFYIFMPKVLRSPKRLDIIFLKLSGWSVFVLLLLFFLLLGILLLDEIIIILTRVKYNPSGDTKITKAYFLNGLSSQKVV